MSNAYYDHQLMVWVCDCTGTALPAPLQPMANTNAYECKVCSWFWPAIVFMMGNKYKNHPGQPPTPPRLHTFAGGQVCQDCGGVASGVPGAVGLPLPCPGPSARPGAPMAEVTKRAWANKVYATCQTDLRVMYPNNPGDPYVCPVCTAAWHSTDIQNAQDGDLIAAYSYVTPTAPKQAQAAASSPGFLPLFGPPNSPTPPSPPAFNASNGFTYAASSNPTPPSPPLNWAGTPWGPLHDALDEQDAMDRAKVEKPTCLDCRRELSSYLDAWHGKDDYYAYASICAPCRSKRGIR